MKVTCQLKTYPDNEKEPSKPVIIRNHWNMDDRVYLVIDDVEHVLIKRDLLNAISACAEGGL